MRHVYNNYKYLLIEKIFFQHLNHKLDINSAARWEKNALFKENIPKLNNINRQMNLLLLEDHKAEQPCSIVQRCVIS